MIGIRFSVHLLLMRGIANYGVGEFKAAWEQTKAAYALDDNMPCTHENALGGGDPAIIARHFLLFVRTPACDCPSLHNINWSV